MEIIIPCFYIIVVASITERIVILYNISFQPCTTEGIRGEVTPSVVVVNTDLGSCLVINRNNIAMIYKIIISKNKKLVNTFL